MITRPTTTLSGTPHEAWLPSCDEMRALDDGTIARGVTALSLMERAGKAMADHIFALPSGVCDAIAILCGSGNNGGDGLVVERELRSRGVKTTLIVVAKESYSPLTKTLLDDAIRAGATLHFYGKAKTPFVVQPADISEIELRELLRASSCVVDALLGIGQTESPRGDLAKLLLAVTQTLSESSTALKPVVALDVPTGVNASTGECFTPHVQATTTLTVEFVKRGLLQSPAKEACGEIRALSIGIDGQAPSFSLITPPSVTIRNRPRDAHKGQFGKVLVIGGSTTMPGAPLLSALGALRCGAGLVSVTRLGMDAQATVAPELLVVPISSTSGFLTAQNIEEIASAITSCDALVVGPGIGVNESTYQALQLVLERAVSEKKGLVIDADALTLLAQLKHSGVLSLPPQTILTPHPGEMGRLLGITSLEVQRDRYKAALTCSQLYRATCILKGASSIVTSTEGRGVVNSTGNPWMATPGSGDVLSGVVATFLAQGDSSFEAARKGVYLHGLGGDIAHEATGATIIASDIVNALPHALGRCMIPFS